MINSYLDQLTNLTKHNAEMLKTWSRTLIESSSLAFNFYREVTAFQKKNIDILTHPQNSHELQEYVIDFAQRQILFWDVLRKRGNQYLKHIEEGSPPVLIFDYEMVIDGRTMERPVNYALVSIRPPKGVKIDNNKRPYLIVDPRSGHGSGIGGFKDDSQVGVALRAGHPVYFVIFFPEPEVGQTLQDIAACEKKFCEAILACHPNSPKLCIIGNCQGGWSVMILAATSPDLAGGLVINGAPLSYWAGENGKNPLRVTGGLIGGSWPVLLASDLGNGRFDGANLVANFERLNPGHTFWEKFYNLFANIDTGEERYLNFERWWGGFYLMNAEEIRSIVENLFIGNFLTHGKIPIDRYNNVDLRKIHSPIIVFCSEGDNITPPQQALNWITDIYKNEMEIKEAKQTIIYLVHRDIGHLGIFVASHVAKKEHSEIVDVLDYIELIPPGLYEMIIHENTHPKHIEDRYEITFEERTIKDIIDKNPEDHKQERDLYRAARKVSQFNSMAYDLFFSNFARAFSNEITAKLLREVHPLRMNRYIKSDLNPFFKCLAPIAETVRKERQPVNKANTFLNMQNDFSHLMLKMLNNYQEVRDNMYELMFSQIYGQLAIMWSDHFDREEKHFHVNSKTNNNIDQHMVEGDKVDAIVRVILLIASAQKFVKGERISDLRTLLRESGILNDLSPENVREKTQMQTQLVGKDPEQALQTLPRLIHSKEEHALVIKTLQKLLKSLPLLSPKAEEMWARIRHVLSYTSRE